MSLNTKLTAARDLVQVLKKWPNDSHKLFPSFRDAQIALYENTSKASSLPSAQVLQYRAVAATTLLNDTKQKEFPVSEEMMHPDGNPSYYHTILREANKENKKVSTFRAARETLFGWWK